MPVPPSRPASVGLALLLSAAFLVTAASPGEAATRRKSPTARQAMKAAAKPAVRPAAKAAVSEVKPAKPIPSQSDSGDNPPATWTAAETDARTCSRNRRKLWQDGEGWVVKAVTVCR